MPAILLLALAAGIATIGGTESRATWQYRLIATPSLAGPSKIGAPGFLGPIELNTPMPGRFHCDAHGDFIAVIKASGKVKWLAAITDPRPGTACQQRYVAPVVDQWHFKPATWRGTPTDVLIQISVDQD